MGKENTKYPKVIAVDFDGCLCTGRWPEIGEENRAAINELAQRKSEGDRIILWTCREGERLEEAVQWCMKRGLVFDAVNENLPENKEKFGSDCRKVFAHEYWDDRAVPVSAQKPGVFLLYGCGFPKTAGRIMAAIKRSRTLRGIKMLTGRRRHGTHNHAS